MARARVTIKDNGPLSLSVGGRQFVKGQPQVVTDPAEIARFKTEQGIFTVEELDSEPVAPAREEAAEEDEADGEDELEAPKLTEESMRTMNKKALLEAAEAAGVTDLDLSMTKADMMAAITLALKD